LKANLESHQGNINFLEGQRLRGVAQVRCHAGLSRCFDLYAPTTGFALAPLAQQLPELIDEVMIDLSADLAERHAKEVLAWQGLVKHYTQLIEHAAAYQH